MNKHWRSYVSKDNPDLHFWDVLGHTPIQLTISGWRVKQSGGQDKKELLFIAFQGKKKEFGLNVTNAFIIGKMHGPDPDGWVGKQITLRVATCRGEECLRVQYPRDITFPKNIPQFKFIDQEKPSGSRQQQSSTRQQDGGRRGQGEGGASQEPGDPQGQEHQAGTAG